MDKASEAAMRVITDTQYQPEWYYGPEPQEIVKADKGRGRYVWADKKPGLGSAVQKELSSAQPFNIRALVMQRMREAIEENREEVEELLRLDFRDEDCLILYGQKYENLTPEDRAHFKEHYEQRTD